MRESISIARLELLGALCAARAGSYVANAMGVPQDKCYFFTDSLLNLLRIQQGPGKWRQWVGNRIKAINEVAPSAQWRFCPGEENPADYASRGMSAQDLLMSSLWWRGPQFLQKTEEEWPVQKTKMRTKEMMDVDRPEEKDTVEPLAMICVGTQNPLLGLLQRSSSWARLTRSTAWIFRFLCVLRRRVENSQSQSSAKHKTKSPRHPKAVLPLENLELNWAETFWLKEAQKLEFRKELQDLKRGQEVEKRSTLTTLLPILRNGLLCSQSRLRLSACMTSDSKYPVILPKHSPIVELLVMHFHRLLLHAGAEQVLAFIKKKFHIMGNRREVKRITHLCKAPKCRKGVPLSQRMGALPPERSDHSQNCFETTGMDFFGPLFVKHDCAEVECPHKLTESKVYVCLFTCFTSRAVHLELVSDLTTETFLLALRRFIARRGIPRTCYSDNAKTFQSAEKELRKVFKSINWNSVQDAMSKYKITFEFSTSNAPWTNGVTERMIGLTKKALRIILHSTQLTARQLETVLVECEAIVNNRPLATVKEGDVLLPITPAQLCIGKDLLLLPCPGRIVDCQKEPQFINKWRHRKSLINSFWKRWRNDYLLSLSPTKKWPRMGEDILNPGDVVVLRDDHLGKNEWRLARIRTVHIGKDKLPRSAEVQLPSGRVVHRHLNKLALLEEDMSVRPP